MPNADLSIESGRGLARGTVRPELVDYDGVGDRHEKDGEKEHDDRHRSVVDVPPVSSIFRLIRERVEAVDLGPVVPTPDLDVVEPRSNILLPGEE